MRVVTVWVTINSGRKHHEKKTVLSVPVPCDAGVFGADELL